MLTVDVGNSSVGVARHVRTHVGVELSLEIAAEPLIAAALVDGACAGIAVSEPRWLAFCDAVRARGLPEPRRLSGIPLPLADERLASTAGQDRLALALAVGAGPAIAVDAGTALTLDVLDAEGVYRGGFIAPGPSASLFGLSQATHALPALGGTPSRLELGVDTTGALSAGAWGLAVGGVDRLLEEALASLGAQAQRARVLVTGGWGAAWAAASRHTQRLEVDPLLVHRGLARWAATS
ncbi:MAG: type III pantothenate kinase [Planctomycetota bacterium]|nr:MAG: type III pantothenate kinase [Planctomycetota bacterium]